MREAFKKQHNWKWSEEREEQKTDVKNKQQSKQYEKSEFICLLTKK